MEKSVPCTTASTMTAMKTENQDNASSISTLVNGTILKTALTNPSEVTILSPVIFTTMAVLYEFGLYNYNVISVMCAGRLSQTKARQRCEFVQGPYVFNRSHCEHDQESCGLRRIPRHRYFKGNYDFSVHNIRVYRKKKLPPVDICSLLLLYSYSAMRNICLTKRGFIVVLYRIWRICSNTIPTCRPSSCRSAIQSCTNWCSGPSVFRST